MLLTHIDRATSRITNLDRMFTELSPHMTEFEVDRCVSYMNTLAASKLEANYTVDDASAVIRLVVGAQRYEHLKTLWAVRNQHLVRTGKTRYVRKNDNTVWDGLDPTDNPDDYTEVTV